MATKEQLESFHQFASRQLDAGVNLAMDELLELWRLESMPPEELAESVKAVRQALAAMDDEDQWVDADVHLAELRKKYGITARP